MAGVVPRADGVMRAQLRVGWPGAVGSGPREGRFAVGRLAGRSDPDRPAGLAVARATPTPRTPRNRTIFNLVEKDRDAVPACLPAPPVTDNVVPLALAGPEAGGPLQSAKNARRSARCRTAARTPDRRVRDRPCARGRRLRHTYLALDHQLDGPVAINEYFPADVATRRNRWRVSATAADRPRRVRLGPRRLPRRGARHSPVQPSERGAGAPLSGGQRHSLHRHGVRRERIVPVGNWRGEEHVAERALPIPDEALGAPENPPAEEPPVVSAVTRAKGAKRGPTVSAVSRSPPAPAGPRLVKTTVAACSHSRMSLNGGCSGVEFWARASGQFQDC